MQDVIGRLLGGEPVSDEDLCVGRLGQYREEIETMRRASAEGGIDRVHRSFGEAVERHPELRALAPSAFEHRSKTHWTVRELRISSFPEPAWVIPSVLPEGLTVLGGRPKVGKSWLALQFAATVGGGRPLWGNPAKRSKVLALTLEDSPRRLKKRLRLQSIPDDCEIEFAFSWESLAGNGIDRIAEAITKNDYGLVILDTASRALPGVDQNSMDAIAPIIADLQDITKERSMAILMVDHHVKPKLGSEPNVVNDVLGSTAKTAGADCLMGLYRAPGQHTATLGVTGRDVEDIEFRLTWHGQTGSWLRADNEHGVPTDGFPARVIETVASLTEADELPTTTRIAERLHCDKQQVSPILSYRQ